MNVRNKKVTVVGLGKSGLAAARLLHGKGARVRVTDASENPGVLRKAAELEREGISVETGRHSSSMITSSDAVVTSPGVPPESLPLALAVQKGIPVLSEVELAYGFCAGKIIAVTGSNGKTTTSHLLHQMFADAGLDSVLCGNVGFSFVDALPRIRRSTRVVLELSSFQLEAIHRFCPEIAVVLNIAPNHLDRHAGLEAYAQAKERIFKNQKGSHWLVLNAGDPLVRAMRSKAAARTVYFGAPSLTEGVSVTDGRLVNRTRKGLVYSIPTSEIRLQGAHNLENAMAALAVAGIEGLPEKAVRGTLESFCPLEHRVEPLGEAGGVRFYNDSKSTTIESTRAALQAVPSPVVLVAGGRNKGLDFASVEPFLEARVKKAVLYGEAGAAIASSWKRFNRFERTSDFSDAVRLAYRSCGPGDSLLLSPMCASYDQFSSFEARGEAFKKLFREFKRLSEPQAVT